MNTAIIRKYEHGDREDLVALLRLNTPAYFSPNEEKDLIGYLENHADNHFLYTSNGHLLGCGGFNLSKDGRTAMLSWDIVHPDFHGRGIGNELTNYRINAIKEIPGVGTLSVRTSQLAFEFYQKFGLELKEIIKDYWDVGFDMYLLDRNIEDVVTARNRN